MPGGSGGGMPGSGDWTGLDLGRFFPGRGLAKRQLNHPARRISLRSASARLNSTRTTDHASALQRVWSITRRTRLMRSQGCQRRASVTGPAPCCRSSQVGIYRITRMRRSLLIRLGAGPARGDQERVAVLRAEP